jgi:hypothetical protein
MKSLAKQGQHGQQAEHDFQSNWLGRKKAGGREYLFRYTEMGGWGVMVNSHD